MALLIYLASPFSHPSDAVRNHRYLEARRFTIDALLNGVAIFSPIVYGKDMETAVGTAFEPWQGLNDVMIRSCEAVWVLCLEDWIKSRGVRHEIEFAHSLSKPVYFFAPGGRKLDVDY